MKVKHLFVYGTLQSGFGNNSLLRGQTTLLGKATTLESYGLTNCGFPYMMEDSLCNQYPVMGELYEIDDDTVLTRTDWLEGVDSGHYRREVVPIKHNDRQYLAYAYFTDSDTGDGYETCPVVVDGDETYYKWERL